MSFFTVLLPPFFQAKKKKKVCFHTFSPHPPTRTPRWALFLVFVLAQSTSFPILLLIISTPKWIFLASLLLGTWYNCTSAFFFFYFALQARWLALTNEVWAAVTCVLSGWKFSKLLYNLPSPLPSLAVMDTWHWSSSKPWCQVRSRVPWLTHTYLWSRASHNPLWW